MALADEITAWEAADLSGNLLVGKEFCGGLPTAAWTHASGASGGTTSPGRTFIFPARPFSSAQNVNRVKFYVNAYYGSTPWKFKVFRWNSTDWELVSEAEISVSATGIKDVTLSPAIAVQAGDICGIFLPINGAQENQLALQAEAVSADADARYTTGDITTHNAFSSTLAYYLDLVAWEDGHVKVHGAGLPGDRWAYTTGFSGGAASPGRTWIFPSRAFRQAGVVSGVSFRISTHNAASAAWKLKVFRWDGTDYNYVGESALTDFVAADRAVGFACTSEITVQVGDVPGLFIPDNGGSTYNELRAQASTGTLDARYVAGDITEDNAFTATLAAIPLFECFMKNPPFLAITGDSISEGHNNGGASSAGSYHTEFHDTTVVSTLPGGVNTSEILHEISVLQAMTYQNIGKGSQTYAWVASTGAPTAFAQQPWGLVIVCGVNDVSGGRTWANVEANLDTIYAAFQASNTEALIICEILPWTAGTAGQATTIRDWNGYLATWAVGKTGVSVVSCHEAMWDPEDHDSLLAAYDFDGVHLTTAGVAALADIVDTHLEALTADGENVGTLSGAISTLSLSSTGSGSSVLVFYRGRSIAGVAGIPKGRVIGGI